MFQWRRSRYSRLNLSSSSRGFTLVEVLIASSISALLAVAMVDLLAGVFNLSRGLRERDDIRRDAQLAVSLIRRDLSQATNILSAGGGTLILVTAAGDTVRHARIPSTSDTLARQVGTATARTIATHLDSLSFELHTVSHPFTSEVPLGCSVENTVAGFAEGDWDEWVEHTSCDYDNRVERRIKDREWCAEEFWPTESFDSFSHASLRVRAKDKNPPDVDILVKVYAANPISPNYPSTLLAQGSISHLTLTSDYRWKEVALTPIGSTPVTAGAHYWIVWSANGSGTYSYAGHIQYELLKNCTFGDLPDNGMVYRQSDNAGTSWDTALHRREAFFSVKGLQTVTRLTEVASAVAETLGVTYRLSLGQNGLEERRVGYVALHNL